MKLYPRIPHLPGSRTGPADRTLDLSLARRLAELAHPSDTLLVQEKLDGTCVAVLRQGGHLQAFGREGRPCLQSRNENRQAFAHWLEKNRGRFGWLSEGERAIFEWLPVAHGVRYHFPHEPLVLLDVFDGEGRRLVLQETTLRTRPAGFLQPALLHHGGALPVGEALEKLGKHGKHGALDQAEGVVYRLEREGRVLSLAKFVRAGHVSGRYLSDHTGLPDVFNLYPTEVTP